MGALAGIRACEQLSAHCKFCEGRESGALETNIGPRSQSSPTGAWTFGPVRLYVTCVSEEVFGDGHHCCQSAPRNFSIPHQNCSWDKRVPVTQGQWRPPPAVMPDVALNSCTTSSRHWKNKGIRKTQRPGIRSDLCSNGLLHGSGQDSQSVCM